MPAKRAEKAKTPAATAPRGALDALSEAVESGAGLLIVYYWDEITGIFGGNNASLAPLLELAAQATGS